MTYNVRLLKLADNEKGSEDLGTLHYATPDGVDHRLELQGTLLYSLEQPKFHNIIHNVIMTFQHISLL